MAAPSLFGLENLFGGLEGFPDRVGDAWTFHDLDDCVGGGGEEKDVDGNEGSGFLGREAILLQVGTQRQCAEDLDLSGLHSFNQFPISGYLAQRVKSSQSNPADFSLQLGPLDNSRMAPFEYDAVDISRFQLDPTAVTDPSGVTCNDPTASGDQSYQQHNDSSRPSSFATGCNQLMSSSDRGPPTKRGEDTSKKNKTESRKHQCSICKDCFPVPRELKRHIECVHQHNKISCPNCGRQFKNRPDNLTRHLKQYCRNGRKKHT